jgi:hypothetical protein
LERKRKAAERIGWTAGAARTCLCERLPLFLRLRRLCWGQTPRSPGLFPGRLSVRMESLPSSPERIALFKDWALKTGVWSSRCPNTPVPRQRLHSDPATGSCSCPLPERPHPTLTTTSPRREQTNCVNTSTKVRSGGHTCNSSS